jgi:hypothetical protein
MRLSVKGIIFGILVVLVLDIVVAFVKAGLSGRLHPKSATTEERKAHGMPPVTMSTNSLLVTMLMGNLITMIGGFTAARIAQSDFYLNSGAIGLCGLLIGVLFSKGYPLWFNAIALVLVVPAALLGGHLARILQGIA